VLVVGDRLLYTHSSFSLNISFLSVVFCLQLRHLVWEDLLVHSPDPRHKP